MRYEPTVGLVGCAAAPAKNIETFDGKAAPVEGLRLFIPTDPARWYQATCVINFKTVGKSTAWAYLYEDETLIGSAQSLGEGMKDQLVLTRTFQPRKPGDSLYEVWWEGRPATLYGENHSNAQLVVTDLGTA
jgi:hypothetical protein